MKFSRTPRRIAAASAALVVVTALAAAPLPFLLLSDALRALDPSLLEAARVHGAMPHLVFRRIVLPLLLPAGLASAVLVFVQAIGMFSVPAVLGMPAGFNVATTEIYQLLESYPPRTADATAWGMLPRAAESGAQALEWLRLGESFDTDSDWRLQRQPRGGRRRLCSVAQHAQPNRHRRQRRRWQRGRGSSPESYSWS